MSNSKNYRFHRISHLYTPSKEFLNNNYLVIGFGEFSNHKEIETYLDFKSAHEYKPVFNELWGWHNKVYPFKLFNFLNGMKRGDTILVPESYSFSAYRIVGDKPICVNSIPSIGGKYKCIEKSDDGFWHLKNNLNVLDLGFAWQVEPIRTGIGRSDYATSDLTSALKNRTTNGNLNRLSESIEKAIANAEQNTTIDIVAEIKDHTVSTIREIIGQNLNPDKFEALVATYFQKLGADAVVRPSKNSRNKVGDADVIATFNAIQVKIYVQIKFHQGFTGSHAINQVSGYVKNIESSDDSGFTNLAWVITNAEGFHIGAKGKAIEENIRLIAGTEFVDMLLDAGLSGL